MTARIDNEFRVVRRRRVTEPEQREEKGIRLAEGMDIMLNDPHRHAAVLRACEIGLALRGAYTTEEKIQLRKEIKEHLTALHGSFATLADRDKLLKAYLGDGDDITHAEMESDYVMPRSEGGYEKRSNILMKVYSLPEVEIDRIAKLHRMVNNDSDETAVSGHISIPVPQNEDEEVEHSAGALFEKLLLFNERELDYTEKMAKAGEPAANQP